MAHCLQCDRCGQVLPVHASYIVRMDVFADPSMPPIDTSSASDAEVTASLSDLMNELKHLSSDELMNCVHRRFEYRLCAACHRAYLTNPLGKPTVKQMGFN